MNAVLVPGAVEEAKIYLDQHEISRAHFEPVKHMVEGFESPYGLELLVAVHWAMSREGATHRDSLERKVYGWNARKRAVHAASTRDRGRTAEVARLAVA